MCVRELLSMAPRCSDLSITRSIKLLIPKIQASNSSTEVRERNPPGRKKTLGLFLGGWRLKPAPIPCLVERELRLCVLPLAECIGITDPL